MYSKELKSIIGSMLNVDPKKRPTVKQILKDPLIVSRVRCILMSKEYKDTFARGLMMNENYMNEYHQEVKDKPDLSEDQVKKIKDYDEKLSGLQHGDYKPFNNMDEKEFWQGYNNYISLINPGRNGYKK